MAKEYYPGFSAQTELEIEEEQKTVHEKYWERFCEFDEPSGLGSSSDTELKPLPVRQPKKLTYLLACYASELFEIEARRYPRGEYLQLWLNQLAQRVFDLIMDRIHYIRDLDYHAPEEAMRRAVMESLRHASNLLLQGLPDIPKVTEKVTSSKADKAGKLSDVAKDRQSLLVAYKGSGREKGIGITDEMIAKAANPGRWNDRTMVTWWKRNDPRCKHPHDKKIRAVLGRDPALVWHKK